MNLHDKLVYIYDKFIELFEEVWNGPYYDSTSPDSVARFYRNRRYKPRGRGEDTSHIVLRKQNGICNKVYGTSLGSYPLDSLVFIVLFFSLSFYLCPFKHRPPIILRRREITGLLFSVFCFSEFVWQRMSTFQIGINLKSPFREIRIYRKFSELIEI